MAAAHWQGAAGHVDGEEEEEDGAGGASDGAWAWREQTDLAGRDAEALIAAMDLGLDMSLLDEGARPYFTERINQMVSPKSIHPQTRQLNFITRNRNIKVTGLCVN